MHGLVFSWSLVYQSYSQIIFVISAMPLSLSAIWPVSCQNSFCSLQSQMNFHPSVSLLINKCPFSWYSILNLVKVMLASAFTDKIGTSSRIACKQLKVNILWEFCFCILSCDSYFVKSSTKVKTYLHIAVIKQLKSSMAKSVTSNDVFSPSLYKNQVTKKLLLMYRLCNVFIH